MPIIREEVLVHASPERCFDLMRSVDLHVDSSTLIAARAESGRRAGLSEPGDVTVWSAVFFGLRFSMTTTIKEFSRPSRFADVLTGGALKQFQHVYTFQPRNGCCVVTDELRLLAPCGPLGRLMEACYLKSRMRFLVCSRLAAIKAVAEGDEWQRYVGV